MYRNDTSQQGAGAALLLITALIWGFAFVAQSVAMDHLGPFTFCAARFLLSGLALVVFLLVRRGLGCGEGRGMNIGRRRMRRNDGIFGGILCGIFLFLGAVLQQIGIKYTTTGKAGFLTALYIILVPIYSILLGRTPKKKVWIAAVIALFGMYLLCMEERFGLSKGDMFCVFCALAFPLQIMAVEIFAQRTDPVFLSCIQFLTVAVISSVFALILEDPEAGALKAALLPLLYAGLMSGAVAYTLQVVGQEKMRNPSAASLIMSLESVFAALGGWILLHQAMTPRKILGCVVMFAAIVLAQL